MSFFGCLIGHRWIYSVEDITYKRMFSVSNTNALDELVLPTQVRCCNRCYKKQRLSSIPSVGSDWQDWQSLSIQEGRDKKLNELGI